MSVPRRQTQEEEVEEVVNNGEEEQVAENHHGENGDNQGQMPDPDEVTKDVCEEQRDLENDEGTAEESRENGDQPVE